MNIDNNINYIEKNLNPTCLLYEDNYIFSDDKKINNVINLWFKYFKLNEIKKENEDIFGKYDLVIKYRPDLNINSHDTFSSDITKNIIYIPQDSKIDKHKLANKQDKYICDVFAYGNSNVMNEYFKIYEKLEYLINKYETNVSETLLSHYFNNFNIKYELLNINYSILLSQCNIFAITGDSGSGKTTLAKLLKSYF